MTIETVAKHVEEILARDRRIETALFRIGEKLGVERVNSERVVDVISHSEVHVRGFDVTLAKIKHDMQDASNFIPDTPVSVIKDGVEIAVVTFLK